MTLAIVNPGLMGDVLYCLPAARWLCEQAGDLCDFHTTSYCHPLKRLLEAQHFIRHVVYYPEGMDWWADPPLNGYAAHHTLRIQGPGDLTGSLRDTFAAKAGAPAGLPIRYDLPGIMGITDPPAQRFVVVAPSGIAGRAGFSQRPVLYEFVHVSPWPVVQVGGVGDYVGELPACGLDRTGLDFLDTAPWMLAASCFVGPISSQLALAEGFDIPKIVVDDGNWRSMRDVIRTPRHRYLANPSVAALLQCVSEAMQ